MADKAIVLSDLPIKAYDNGDDTYSLGVAVTDCDVANINQGTVTVVSNLTKGTITYVGSVATVSAIEQVNSVVTVSNVSSVITVTNVNEVTTVSAVNTVATVSKVNDVTTVTAVSNVNHATVTINAISTGLLTNVVHSTVSVGTASVTLADSSASVIHRNFSNGSSVNVWLGLGTSSVVDAGILLPANTNYVMTKENGNLYRGAVSAIHDSTVSVTIGITESN
jgi:hypothetical protein